MLSSFLSSFILDLTVLKQAWSSCQWTLIVIVNSNCKHKIAFLGLLKVCKTLKFGMQILSCSLFSCHLWKRQKNTLKLNTNKNGYLGKISISLGGKIPENGKLFLNLLWRVPMLFPYALGLPHRNKLEGKKNYLGNLVSLFQAQCVNEIKYKGKKLCRSVCLPFPPWWVNGVK